MIDFEAIEHASVTRESFTYFASAQAMHPHDLIAVRQDFPDIDGTGVSLVDDLTFGTAFARLVNDIRSPRMVRLMSRKLSVDLDGKPLMITVRGHCHKRDGRIHTDSKDKVATALLYLNEQWNAAHPAQTGGRLRLLRGSADMDDMLAEIPPDGGTLVAFRRSDSSWHGHHPYQGPRRYVMFNWLTSQAALSRNVARHRLSARVKRLMPFAAWTPGTGSTVIR